MPKTDDVNTSGAATAQEASALAAENKTTSCEHDWITDPMSGIRVCAHCRQDQPNTTDAARYRDALQWVHERLSVDGRMTESEQRLTYHEIGNVLFGRSTLWIDAWKERVRNASR